MDISNNKIDIEKLMQVYGVANTPAYLYKHFRSNHFVYSLSKEYTIKELIDEFLQRGENIRNSEDLVIAYAIYIAITYKDYNEAKLFFDNQGDISFEWFPDIKSIFISSYIPTQILTFSIVNTEPDKHNFFSLPHVIPKTHLSSNINIVEIH